MLILEIEEKITIGPVVVLGSAEKEVRAGYTEKLEGRNNGFSGSDYTSKVLEVVTPVTIRVAQFKDGELVSGSAKYCIGSQINEDPSLRDRFLFINSDGESNGSRRRLILFGHVF